MCITYTLFFVPLSALERLDARLSSLPLPFYGRLEFSIRVYTIGTISKTISYLADDISETRSENVRNVDRWVFYATPLSHETFNGRKTV